MSETTADLEQDRTRILHLHREWWAANEELEVDRMAVLFPVGSAYHMFNMNGHPYFGIDEKVHLWRWLKDHGLRFGRPEMKIVRFEIQGDVAWIAAEGGSVKNFLDDPELRQTYYRSTEIYRRDDGEGNPDWRMWHFHGDYLPDLNAVRPAFDDTYVSRGVGWPGDES